MSQISLMISKLNSIESKLDLLLTEKTNPTPQLEAKPNKKNDTSKLILEVMQPGNTYSAYELYKLVSASPKLLRPVKEANISSALGTLKNNKQIIMLRKGLYTMPASTEAA